MNAWVFIFGLGIFCFLFFIDGLISSNALRRLAKAAEDRNAIELMALSANFRTQAMSQMKVDKIVADKAAQPKDSTATL